MKEKKKTIDFYMELPYSLEITPDVFEGGFGARYPELPGCLTCGDTLEETYENALDAKRTWLKAEIEDGHKIKIPPRDYMRPDQILRAKEIELEELEEELEQERLDELRELELLRLERAQQSQNPDPDTKIENLELKAV